jgi:hypothetical protein
MHGVESKCRNRSPEETLAIFKEMQEGTERGLTNCIRFKLDMQNPNKALRDPVAFRCNLTPHWRTGEKYKVGRHVVTDTVITMLLTHLKTNTLPNTSRCLVGNSCVD